MAMTQRRFLENVGSICPNCGHDDVLDTEYVWENGNFSIDQYCPACHASWEVTATLTGCINLALEN